MLHIVNYDCTSNMIVNSIRCIFSTSSVPLVAANDEARDIFSSYTFSAVSSFSSYHAHFHFGQTPSTCTYLLFALRLVKSLLVVSPFFISELRVKLKQPSTTQINRKMSSAINFPTRLRFIISVNLTIITQQTVKSFTRFS